MKYNKNIQHNAQGALINIAPPPRGKSKISSYIKSRLILLTMTGLISQSSLMYAQSWVAATVTNSSYSGSSAYSSGYINNDIDRTQVNGYNEILGATAWDGVNYTDAAIGWNYDDGHGHTASGILSYAHNLIRQADVKVIRKSSTSYYIVACYMNQGTGLGAYACWYHLTITPNLPSAPTLTWSSISSTALSTASYLFSMHLDGDAGDKMVAVWTESVSGTYQIKAKTAKFVSNTLTWSSNTFTFPSFTYNSTTYAAPFKDADVGLFEKANGNSVATFCLVEHDNITGYDDKLIISNDIDFSDLEAGMSFSSLAAYKVVDYAGTAIIQHPRIARHKQKDTWDQTGWTVVFLKYTFGSPNVSDICGITTFNNSSTNQFDDNGVQVYTDGINGPTFFNYSNKQLPAVNQNGDFNYDPVVSYERRSGSGDPNPTFPDNQVIVIAFNHYDGTNYTPLAFYIETVFGRPFTKYTSGTFMDKFYAVPYSASGDERYIAVSGFLSQYFMYSWGHLNSPYTVEYKIVNSKNNLRIGNVVQNEPAIIFSQDYAIPFDIPVDFRHVQLYSTTGMLLTGQNTISDFTGVLSKLNNGLYIARFEMNDDSSVTRKIIISK